MANKRKTDHRDATNNLAGENDCEHETAVATKLGWHCRTSNSDGEDDQDHADKCESTGFAEAFHVSV